MFFVFGDSNVHHKGWLTSSGGTDQAGDVCYNFSISNGLNQMINFPTRIPYCDSHSPALLDLLISSDGSICSTMAFPLLWNSDHIVVSVSIPVSAASEFCEWVQVDINVYIPHRKYQVKSHLSPWFSTTCNVAIAHGNHFFRLYQKDKSSASEVNFGQASNRCKRVLKAAKLACVNKAKESITSLQLGYRDLICYSPSIQRPGGVMFCIW